MDSLHLSHRTQLLVTAAIASVTTAGILFAYNSHDKRIRRRKLDDEIRRSIASHDSGKTQKPKSVEESIVSRAEESLDYDEELIREQLARNYAFFGEQGMANIRNANVVVVGCGGVGSWAAVMLVRSYVALIFVFSLSH